MDIKHLQYFIEVSNFNSFSRAAEHLFITQPTISKMIKNLETELGVELFDRSRKKLALTDAGQIILEQAKLIDKAFNNLETELDNLTGLKKGHIRIGLPPIFYAHFFLKIISSFHEKYPGITFQLVEDGSKKIEEDVTNNLLDVGIIVLPTKNDIFDHFSFMEEDLKLILHPSHRLAEKKEVQLAELANESFILFNKDFVLNDRIILSCNSVGFNPHIISESSQQSFIEEMVASKLGISLLPESICDNLNTNVKSVKVVNPSISWNLAIIWGKNQYFSYAAKEWLQFTKEQLTKGFRDD
ncbi:LysR family transcriptional regulator [Metabacillus idriensis]|uniref:LysR family transcriptional regulator n=1 Tax=Metabacillus idriensis TaxID=324768 RepID=A0A6I2MCR9_9BACI|nr:MULTISPECIES: LysR family transcriptional regulator [Bacillaceae]MCM3598232.1 LysR family transcriptional regulator [Metabacillus idriensis]MRX55144.1 LysR family transcriptional regulator [Metabacillus idriensis]OHR71788.1 LysR family transcriptional regulator [Bacillus sp. HMSC76G11]TDL77967.1 LysR family transcriptional regulator [Peribacillus frigoritolerans]